MEEKENDSPGLGTTKFTVQIDKSFFEYLDIMGWKISEPVPDGENWIYTITRKDGE
jgi:hypothetical protein